MSPPHDAQRLAAPTADVVSLPEPRCEVAQPPGSTTPSELERRLRALESRVRAAEAERDQFAWACREARNAQRDAEAARRAGEDILAVVTHDLRNPLGAIVMGLTSLVQGSGPLDEDRVRTVAERIQRQAERMTHQVINLGDFAAIQAGRLAIVPARHAPSAILAEVSELVGPVARERGIAFAASAEADLPEVECDGACVAQALSNLATNAIKVTPRGGAIEVGVGLDPRGFVFVVRDSGPGLPPEELGTLFAPRWRSQHAGYRGAGLGSSMRTAAGSGPTARPAPGSRCISRWRPPSAD
jgi:signal transduction histidine kinase